MTHSLKGSHKNLKNIGIILHISILIFAPMTHIYRRGTDVFKILFKIDPLNHDFHRFYNRMQKIKNIGGTILVWRTFC